MDRFRKLVLISVSVPARNTYKLSYYPWDATAIEGEHMFKTKVKPEVLKELVDIVSVLVDEAKFTATKSKLVVKAVDPAHVAMVDLTLKKDAFEEFSATETELGVDLDKVKEVLRLAKPGDIITIEHNEEKNVLAFKVGNINRTMALVDPAGMSDPKVPNLNLPVKVVVSTEQLRQGIRASESISDHLALVASPDSFEIVAEGDTDHVDLKLPKDALESLECKEAARSLFPLDYFSNMIKAIQSAPTITMQMGNDYPVKMDFTIAGGKGEGQYLLAPRIESE
jgi:proliferating cell nuclear antigen